MRWKREEGKQNVGFSSRPFVLCGLPVRKPTKGETLYERRNGNLVLQITGHPHYGLPFGQDRIVPSTWQHWPFDSKVRRYAFGPQPKCWRHSASIRVARNTED